MKGVEIRADNVLIGLFLVDLYFSSGLGGASL